MYILIKYVYLQSDYGFITTVTKVNSNRIKQTIINSPLIPQH